MSFPASDSHRSCTGRSIRLSSGKRSPHLTLDNVEYEQAPTCHRAFLLPDILSVIAVSLQEAQLYGTLASLALASRTHQGVLQSSVEKVKKKSVLNMEDYRWRDQANDGNVE